MIKENNNTGIIIPYELARKRLDTLDRNSGTMDRLKRVVFPKTALEIQKEFSNTIMELVANILNEPTDNLIFNIFSPEWLKTNEEIIFTVISKISKQVVFVVAWYDGAHLRDPFCLKDDDHSESIKQLQKNDSVFSMTSLSCSVTLRGPINDDH